ncbi:hypothetical protein CLV59_101745 [Chitinophaga dinghuensis]|uniref:Uncharacterized protein n=1 Tax=Chitinophaga dinghuensis TaxID=1539050 RepID=A0A327WF44_9BACT|nr:hypothetical protein [Chitinophaga dinghuensis]RAJ87980.1 hypothetical protein CLV59_101745 [Chitinophaga dinghuensis]
MKTEINYLLVDTNDDRRVQYYYALDLLGNRKACICMPSLDKALAYLQSHPEFRPDYIFANTINTKSEKTAFNTQVQILPEMSDTTVVFSHYDEIYFSNDDYKVVTLINQLKARLQQVQQASQKRRLQPATDRR